MFMNTTTTTIMTAGAAILTLGTGLYSAANAASLNVPASTVIQGTNVFSGISFIVNGSYSPTDTISIDVSGTVDLDDGNLTENAAGVIIDPAITSTGQNPGQVYISSGMPSGALLIGNNSLGFFPLFPANAANGLGNSTPPTMLSLSNVPLSSIFGNSFTGLTGNTVLEFRINDINSFDNSGSFTVINTASTVSVPEPSSTLSLLVLGTLGVASTIKRKQKQ